MSSEETEPDTQAVRQPDEEVDRQSQPVDAELPPRLPFAVVGIGASAGGLEATTAFLSAVRADSGMAYVLIQHLPPAGETVLADILRPRAKIPVSDIDDAMRVQADHLYVIRPGCTVTIKDGAFHLGKQLSRPMNNRPIDDFFKSLAEEQRERAVAIVLSGMGSNGSAGAQAVKAVGGLCIAQDPESARYPSMPRQLIEAGYADYILQPRDIPDVLLDYVRHPYASGQREHKPILARKDQQHLTEILAVLRTRTRQDFNGYKKPTILRRVQRRMGLNRLTRIGDYAKFLRQTPAEVGALADDLLIHVTGFFRDPQAWEALRTKVVVPLISSRESGSSIRCWVTACSSGEEAYSLAMLLVEEAERVNKLLDIKVFATDMAARTLQNARGGVYPGGIEAEIQPRRLERFFLQEDAVYRVRPDLRERVVFAPQNVLQDPPFSRLDIVSCRNLLIYLEPEAQVRIMSLLHFSLREGGTLFLGSSETAGSDALFEVIDKKARLFRRKGPTRHGSVSFPLPHVVRINGKREEGLADLRVSVTRPTIAQLTTRGLLEQHVPAAVTIDRDRRIVFYHGNTDPFFMSPRGEPTRDIMQLARESIRGAIRVVLNRVASTNAPATSLGGWVEIEPGERARVAVTASAPDPKNAPDHFIVSFQALPDLETESPAPRTTADANGGADELRRVREELQSTIEELQTSNEELKASHEELISTNEELQSGNEEMETSREEMQSLNEELATVNSQLSAKVEEHQAARNDLSSLLTSTNIAVLFLDSHFRIRRFTPAVRDLLEVIAADVGRPLSDLAGKFTDPKLMGDCRAVLEGLVPIESEVAADNGRWFLRRVTPYRTHENRIDGVVITFVDITERKRSEDALRESEDRLRAFVEGAGDFAMMMLDKAGRITAWNPGAERLTGYTQAEVIDEPGAILFTPEDRAVNAPAREMRQVASTGSARDERWYLRKDATRFWGGGTMTALRAADGSARGFVKILRDETPRKIAEDQVRAAKDAAETANRAKDLFLATLSHELRTPLNAIVGWTSILKNDACTAEDIREGIEVIDRNAQAQSKLIEDVLDVSRIVSGKLKLRIASCQLSTIIGAAVDVLRPAAEIKGVTIDTRYNAAGVAVMCDSDRMQQIVWNLLANAVKFTPGGGRILVSCEREGSSVVIRVRDNGQGIPADFLPYIFDRFRQADSTSRRTVEGLGLGLSIVKHLVELHGATVTAESDGEGRGATFSVRLPVSAVNLDGPGDDREPLAELTPSSSSAARLDGLRVLVVDDHPDARQLLAKVCERAGATVESAGSAREALLVLEKSRPHVVVSDIGMPQMNGLDLIRTVRSNGFLAEDLPAIALTAYAQEADVRQALLAGFQLHVPKPIEPDNLIRIISDLAREAKSSHAGGGQALADGTA